MKVQFFPCKVRDSKILAFGDVMVTEGITVRGFRVVDGPKGLFAAVPSKPIPADGQPRFVNQVKFASPEIRDRFLSELLEDYKRWRQSQSTETSQVLREPVEPRDDAPPF